MDRDCLISRRILVKTVLKCLTAGSKRLSTLSIVLRSVFPGLLLCFSKTKRIITISTRVALGAICGHVI